MLPPPRAGTPRRPLADARSPRRADRSRARGCGTQTFYGHANAVSDVVFNLRGDSLASCDANGVIKLWDVRAVSERASLNAGEVRVWRAAP